MIPRFVQILLLFVLLMSGAWFLPPFFSFWRAMPLVMFLISLIAYWGFDRTVLWQGILYTFLGELFLGLHPGSFSLSFLGALGLLLLTQHFIEIQPLSRQVIRSFGHTWFGSITMLILGYLFLALCYEIVEYLFYHQSLSWRSGLEIVIQPWAMGATLLGVLFGILFLRLTERELL
ncbi:MAG: hypothetical protein KW806_01815 [Candidatus Yanofskybacteria bacterium]|nr:hypothetical protein [Candidatus Yanofskybacteria bacterium]